MNEVVELQNAIIAFGDSIARQISILLKQIQPAIQEAHDILWQAYLEDGAPYGKTEKGLSRWLERMH